MDHLDRRVIDAHESLVSSVEGSVLSYTAFFKRFSKDPKYKDVIGEMRSNLLESISHLRHFDGKAPRGHICEPKLRNTILDSLEAAVKEGNTERMRDFAMSKMCGLKPSIRGQTRPEPHAKPRHH